MSERFDAWLLEEIEKLRAGNELAEARLLEEMLARGWDEETARGFIAGEDVEAL
jgi:hypothetical protein